MRFLSHLARRPRPAAILAAGLATALLGLASVTDVYGGQNAGATVGTPGCSVGVEWRGEPGIFGSCTGTDPDAAPHPAPGPTATVQPGDDTLTGDNNGDGRIEEDESGWDCHTMGNRVCGTTDTETVSIAAPLECEFNDAPQDVFRLCLTVADQPAYGWTNADGSRVDNPDGRTLIADLEEEPGTPEWAAALRALHTEYTEHHPED